MNNLEKYLDQVMEQKPVVCETPLEQRQEAEQEVRPDLFRSLVRRWRVVLATTIIPCVLGTPAIWLLFKPHYIVEGAVRVAPAVQSVLTGQPEGAGGSYGSFMNTQASLLSGPKVLDLVATEVTRRNLSLFTGQRRALIGRLKAKIMPTVGTPDPVSKLRDALTNGTITVRPAANSELLTVVMTSADAEEAKTIVDLFLAKYEELYGDKPKQNEINRQVELRKQQEGLRTDMDSLRGAISEYAKLHGSTALDRLQEMELGRQGALLTELTRLESRESALLASIEQTDANAPISPEQLVAARTEYVNSDPTMTALSAEIVAMKRDLIVARLGYKPGHPVLAQREEVLVALEESLEDTRKELEKKFDEGLDDRRKVLAQQQRAAGLAELRQVRANIKVLNEQLKKQREKTAEIGLTSLALQNSQAQLDLKKQMYEQVSLEIERINIERRGQSRIEPAYDAAVFSTEDKRVKFTVAMVFGALVCGCGLAVLKDKMDKTLQTPEDVARHLDLPVLGTTSSSHTVKPSLFAEQIAADYQTIRTNLGLLTNAGVPRKLAVSSAGMREGKTTFAVNLATSLARSGKKVLLVDGDLRKPDVRYMLNISNGEAGVQDVLMGEQPERAVCAIAASGLHVLAANPRSAGDVYELLASSKAAEQIEKLSREYDHLVIDTPPALAFPDALVWAKLAGAVILVGFAGQTTAPELKEAQERFTRIRVRVLGAILSNVRADQSLYRYGYSYRATEAESVRKARKQRKLLLPTEGSGGVAKAR